MAKWLPSSGHLQDFKAAGTSIVALLKACGQKKDLCEGTRLHANILKRGLLEKNSYIASALVSMYAKCGALTKAQQVLDDLPGRNVVSWSALIAGCAEQGQGKEALKNYERMQHEGVSPDAVTFISVLKACGSIGAVQNGKQIHDEIVSQGLLGKDVVLGTALVDMYVKCGALSKAAQVLETLPARNVVTWNALISGYAQQGQGEEALNCFKKMQREGLTPDRVTFTCILKACGSIGAADKGKQFHDEIVCQGFLGKNIVIGNALVDMYAKCGMLVKAQQVLDELPVRNVVSWSALIVGYAQQGQCEEALNCFEEMQREGLCPDAVTFICILKACGNVGAAVKGKEIHDEIVSQGLLGKDIVLGNTLVDMYAKCGALVEAQLLVDELPLRDVVTWNSLITGYAQHVQGMEALKCFERMQREGLSPDAVTFTCVLNVCSRSGLVDEGQMYLANMCKKYGITPGIEHHTCMIDLFGRVGHLDKAIAVIKKMPSSDNPVVWSSFLSACRKWGNMKLGKWAFERAIQVDISDAPTLVFMASNHEL